jgi:hypothetical protein
MARFLHCFALIVLAWGLTACKEADQVPSATEQESAEQTPPAAEQESQEALPTLAAPEILAELTIAPMDGKATLLRYSPQPVGRHKVELSQESTQARTGRKMDIGTQQTFILNRKLQEEGADGWTTLLTISDLEVKPTKESKDEAMAGAIKALKSALLAVQMVVKLNPQGKVIDLSVRGGSANRWQGMEQVLEQLVKDSVIELPEQAVAPGDRWPMQRESLLKTKKTASKIVYELSSKFLGYAQGIENCPRCAVVHTEGTFTVSGTVTTPGMNGSSTGAGRAASVVVLNLDAGRLVHSETSSASHQTFALKGKNGALKFSEEQRNRLVQEWLGAPDKSASDRPSVGALEVK